MMGLDWAIIGIYLAAMIGLSVFLGRGQVSQEDYYVGGRNLPWWAVGISTMATQTSAISFISIPAFVALKPGGGMSWLQYEMAMPLAMIFVMVFLIPFFRKLELVSVYEFLEHRFDVRVRRLLAGVFLVSRGLGTGVGVYASGIVLSVCLGIPLWATILIIGVVTIIYDTIGGMTAVVYSDVVQMFVLLSGLILCIIYAVDLAGGTAATIAALEPSRWETFKAGHGLGDGASMPFWGFLVGGFFLYASYYGTDQSQVQRELSAPSLKDTKFSLIFNGFARFPLTLLYLGLGLAVGGAFLNSPELQASVPQDKLDYLVPMFILHNLPTGVRAVLFAAILAAAMSSLDSALNSLSASTMQDFIERGRRLDQKKMLRLSKLTTVSWGLVITGFAFLVGSISDTVIEGINKIGSAFYGPILASFIIGVASRRSNAQGVMAGVLAGVGANMALWIFVPGIFWMWWNLLGLVVAMAVNALVSRLTPPPSEEVIRKYTLLGTGLLKKEVKWIPTYAILVGYFVLIMLVMWGVSNLSGLTPA